MELRVLGPVQLGANGRQLPLPGPRLRAVLGVLALHANRVVAIGQLLESVWGLTPPKTARNSLQGHISRLRRLLATADTADRLVFRAPGYLLRVAPGELDLEEFKRLADAGRRLLSLGDATRAGPLLHAALGLWRGRALEDADLPGLGEQIAGLEERRLAVLEDRLQADLGLGRHGELVAELEALVGTYPLRERLRGQQMLALYRAGRPAEALAVFRDTRATLREQLGIDPGPELDRLQRAMLARDPSLELPPALSERGTQAADAGGEAARTKPGAAAGEQLAAASPPVPAQLPAAVSSFVGRVEHLQALDALLAVEQPAPAVVISALAGMAGVGKTALAVHWAHRVRERFGDGQLYVNLRGYASSPPLRPVEALAGFLGALGVPAEQVPVELEQAAGLYRTLLAGKRVLVVLDNARDVEQVRPLLPGSPGCLVLVTSRSRLAGLVARDGAHPLALDVLTQDEAHALLVGILGAERVQAEPDAAAELAHACASLPLALRIAAADLSLHPQRPIARQVTALAAGDRLASLAVEGDERAAVRAAFELSYGALAPAARRLFRLLGLMPGPEATAPAAAALTTGTVEQAAGLLERLADAHLLAQPIPGRYVLHDLLRAYAAERVQQEDSAEERDAATRRLADWYLYTTDAAARLLYPERLRLPLPQPEAPLGPLPALNNHAQALAWLDAERANLLAAVRHTAAEGPHPVAWLIADALRGYYWLRMHTVDWQTVAQAAQAAAEADGDLRYQQAIRHGTRAATLSEQAGWPKGQSTALGNIGVVQLKLGQLEEAADYITQGLAIDRKTGWRSGEAPKIGNLGLVCLRLGQLHQAFDYYTESLALHRQLGSRRGEAVAIGDLGMTLHLLGRIDQALDHLSRAVTLVGEAGDRGVEADLQRALAEVHCDAGRLIQALASAQTALAMARDIGDHQLEAETLTALATVHQRLGQPDQARAHAEQALTLTREASYRLLEGRVRTTLANIHLDQGQPDQARQHAEQALALHRTTGQRLDQAHTLVTLGRALRGDDADAALGCWQEALALFTESGSPEADQARTLLHAEYAQPSTTADAAGTTDR